MKGIVSVLICVCLANTGEAAKITVNLNSSTDYQDIQSALNAASDGDIIEVAPGTYLENLTIRKKITLRGIILGQVTIYPGNIAATIINITAASTLENLIVTGPTKNIGGIAIQDGVRGEVKVDRCQINGVSGGIYMNASQCTLKVTRTDMNSNNYGIYIFAGYLLVNNSIVRNNSNKGTYIYYGAVANITNCVLYKNSNGIGGEYNSFITIKNCIVSKNQNYGAYEGNDISSIIYSCFWENGSNAYLIQSSLGYIEADPLFVDPDNGDFHLKSGSRAIDTGSPGVLSADIDGSPNDMGIYGGPTPFGGSGEEGGIPTVTNISIEPNPVQKGQTITIRATGTVR